MQIKVYGEDVWVTFAYPADALQRHSDGVHQSAD